MKQLIKRLTDDDVRLYTVQVIGVVVIFALLVLLGGCSAVSRSSTPSGARPGHYKRAFGHCGAAPHCAYEGHLVYSGQGR